MSKVQTGELPREEKVLLYVIGILEDLKAKDFVEGGSHRITREGDRFRAELLESGFRPTETELHDAVRFLTTLH